ncbi:hypothetical protein [Falsibacillus pallidus]|uniref:Uncharacterized protein n=1 Tax=Falsibacillus pallidus TaxID=493781 RepID=A0A370GG64_9BACI|nr:hypothetical protein [Falsibacillus pallidus]RDI42216.1 hypothetical protein DFR59_10555 [Falsibacillus pallidus]
MKLDNLLLAGATLIIFGIVDTTREQLGFNNAFEKLVAGIVIGTITWIIATIMGKWFKDWSEIRVKWYVALPIIVGLIIIIPFFE